MEKEFTIKLITMIDDVGSSALIDKYRPIDLTIFIGLNYKYHGDNHTGLLPYPTRYSIISVHMDV